MNIRRSALVLFTLLTLIAVLPARATMEIRLMNNGVDTGWRMCGDAGIVCTSTPGVNAISFNGSVGNYVINASTGTQIKTGAVPFLDLGSSNTTLVTPPGELVIETIIDGFTLPAPGWNFVVNGNGGIGGTATFFAYGGNNNNVCTGNGCDPPTHSPASMNLISSTGPLAIQLAPAGFASTTFGTGTTANPYSLAIRAVIDGTHAGGVSFDAALAPVPEPASVALLGGLLVLSAAIIRRKLRA